MEDDGMEEDGGGNTDTDDFNSDDIWEEENMLEFFLETRRARNIGIAYYNRRSLGSSTTSNWSGCHGTILFFT